MPIFTLFWFTFYPYFPQKIFTNFSDHIFSLFPSFSEIIEIPKYSKRPNIDIEKISTGEFWLGTQAKELGLVDNIMTSADYLTSLYQDNKQVYFVKYERHVPFLEKLMNSISLPSGIFSQNNLSSLVPMAK